jgi:plasmid stabilization system protein ParE
MNDFRASPKLASELDEAVTWYENRSPLAAHRFIKEVEKSLDQICADPGRFPRRGSRYRFARVKKFPYIVAFTLEGGVISIATIRHTSRSNLDLDA